MRRHPRPTSLTFQTLPAKPNRPSTPRRSTFPLPSTITFIKSSTLPVPPLSYWFPDTSSPTTGPLSPLNPFLIPQRYTAEPLIPASPLSVWDEVSVGVVSPLDEVGTEGVGTFLQSPTLSASSSLAGRGVVVSPVFSDFSVVMSPISPRLLYIMSPRTLAFPEYPAQYRRTKVSRKTSVPSLLSMGRQRLEMRVRSFQWLAVRQPEGEETEERRVSGLGWWRRMKWMGRRQERGMVKLKKEREVALRDIVRRV